MGLPNSSRETKFPGANADREIFMFPVQLTTSRIGNLTWLIYRATLVICMCDHTYTCNKDMNVARFVARMKGTRLSKCVMFGELLGDVVCVRVIT